MFKKVLKNSKSRNLSAVRFINLSLVIILSLFVAMGIIGITTPASADSIFDTAPPNPKFQKYIEDPKDEPIFDDQGNYFGFIPMPFEQERREAPTALSRSLSFLRASITDSIYDMRDPNGDGYDSDSLLSSVKYQGNCGSCWAFASLDVLESHIRGNNVNYNFSENNLINKHRFDQGPCEGGNIIFTSAYLSSHRGVVAEQDDQYKLPVSGAYCSTCKPVRYIDNTILVPVRYGINDNQYIKELITEHGALYTSIYYDNNSYYPTTATYYYNDINNSFNDSNHAVVIVGWNDEKFVEGINKTGAFIVKNSWGDDWGDNGYFYVSYYDESIALSTLAYFDDKDDSELKFDKIYQHDEIGWIGGAFNSYSGWGANWFVPEENGKLNAVSFAAANSNLSYEIIIYDERNESHGTVTFSNIITTQTGTIKDKGWYSIPLTKPVNITKNNGFAVAVKFSTKDRKYPVPVETLIENFSSNITINEGESYVSESGDSWIDTYNLNTPYTVCIKALVESECESEDCDTVTECEVAPSTPDITVKIDSTDTTKVNIFWQKDSNCQDTEYDLYYANYPHIIESNLVHMGNITYLSKKFNPGSAFYVVVHAKNSKGDAFSSVKSFEIKCPDNLICSSNKQFTENNDSLDKDQNTVNSNWNFVTMSAEDGVKFINDFYSKNLNFEKVLLEMNINLSKDNSNLISLKKSVWTYEIVKEISYIGDIYLSNEILTSKSGLSALATVDDKGNQGLTFYGTLPYDNKNSGFITAIKEGDCIAYYFFEIDESNGAVSLNGLNSYANSPNFEIASLSGKYSKIGCESDSKSYYSLKASKLTNPITISFVNLDKNIENIVGEIIPDDSLSHIKFDYLFPNTLLPSANNNSVDIYIAISTPSGELLFIDDKGDFTNEFGKVFKVSTTSTIRETFLFKKSLFANGTYKAYWLVTPTNGGNINAINFDGNDYILGVANFSNIVNKM